MAGSGPAAPLERRQPGRAGLLAGGAVVFAVAFLFRFVTAQFINDHFVHLSRAQQILLGDLPIRDFFDPGLFLSYYASAAALILSGHTLLGEAILTVGCVALAAALTFALSARVSGSYLLGVAATMLAVLSVPRLYNYPKIILYVLALWLAWRYVNRPGGRWLSALAVTTAVAFLFRHDHGVYIGSSVATLLVLLYWDEPGRCLKDLVAYAVVSAVLLLPFVLFVQMTVGVRTYARVNESRADELMKLTFNRLPIRIDPAAPIVELGAPRGPRINVRWTQGLDEAERRAREARYSLTWPESVGGSTFSYVVEDRSRKNLSAIVGDPDVEDTHNIDRTTFTLTYAPWWERLDRRLAFARVTRVLPGVLTPGNALAWFYAVAFFLPFVALVVLVASAWRGQIQRPELAFSGSAILLTFVIVQTLVRDGPDTRMADVAGPVAILAAWTTGRLVRRGAHDRRTVAAVARSGVAAFWIVTLWSVFADGGVPASRSVAILLAGPAHSWDVAATVARDLDRRPSEMVAGARTGIEGLTRYIFECTAPSDRVLATYFNPDLYFYAERGFAGGHVFLDSGWQNSPADQRLMVERLERQRVPIVLSLPYDPGRGEDQDKQAKTLPLAFPLVDEYLKGRYTVAAESAFGGSRVFRVLVDSSLTPTGTYEPLGLPCYFAPSSDR